MSSKCLFGGRGTQVQLRPASVSFTLPKRNCHSLKSSGSGPARTPRAPFDHSLRRVCPYSGNWLAAFMYPTVFDHPEDPRKWTLRVAFVGFCVLMLLFVGYF